MPRFSDEWVIERVLFDYVSGGSCACCGIQHSMFLPNGTSDLVTSMTDLDTDQMNAEIDTLSDAIHPWPKNLRDQIWCDRVKLKQKLKLSITKYTQFWMDHGNAFTEWLTPNGDDDGDNHDATTIIAILQRCIQMSRSELLSTIQQRYNIHSAYMVVLTAVIEQVANFEMTAYPYDSIRCSPDTTELHFEQILQFGRMSGFTLPIIETQTEGAASGNESKRLLTLRQDVLQILIDRISTLGNKKLLGRGPSSSLTSSKDRSSNADDGEEEADDDEGVDDVDAPTVRHTPIEVRDTNVASSKMSVPTPSFQSDRRMLRLLLARYWADLLIQRYYTDNGVAVGTTTLPEE